MKLQLRLSLIILSLLSTVGCAHMSDPCNNKPLNRFPSPDRTLFLATYHRECASKVYTMATLEKPKGILQSKGEVVCYLMNWGDRYTIEAAWKSKDTIFISSPDRLEQFDFQDSKESCAGITVKYNVQFRSERQTSDDQEVNRKDKKSLIRGCPVY